MILQELCLHNFGLYRGEQVLQLGPLTSGSKTAPITLFGGINGGGKTTILDALQLALYGPRAQCTKRSGRTYDTFLRESIHYGVPQREGAAVAVRFLYAADGRQQDYEIRRTWAVRDDKVRESLHVSKDGDRDRWLSENWNQVVEDLIPLGISQLCFFDAEKIRFLAEDDTTSEALGTAIKALLGLDLAERLIADSTVLEGRLAHAVGQRSNDPELAELEATISDLTDRIRRLKEKRAAVENDLLVTKKDLQEAEDEFANMGGRHWQKRDSQRQKLQKLSDQQTQLISELRLLTGGELPFALVADFLPSLQAQDAEEQLSRESDVVRTLLEDRDQKLLMELRKKRLSQRSLELIKAWQDQDRQSRKTADVQKRCNLSDSGRHGLHHLIAVLPGLVERDTELLAQLEDARTNTENVERSLAAASAEPRLQPVLDRMKAAAQAHATVEAEANRIDKEVDSLDSQRTTSEQKLGKLRRSRIDLDIKNEESARIAQLVDRTRDTMRSFLEKATHTKIERLSRYVTESFRFLLRKTTLVERIHIDPISFRIVLFDSCGQAVPKERLSEGEKQIFAIALLWGLARSSTRPLPTIVDTPMARLDATHRDYLIERYFPNASHQVIILSTDTEVDRHYYERLHPSLSRAYHLNYDEDQKCTTAEEGYFWSRNGHARGQKVDA